MLNLDKDAIFLNFNYTLFLESEYSIPADRICYIHGNRKDRFGTLVLGHHSDDDTAFDNWIHKNQNRRRYRHVQKDKKQSDRRLTIHRRCYHISIENNKSATAGRYDFFQRLLILLVISAKRYHCSV